MRLQAPVAIVEWFGGTAASRRRTTLRSEFDYGINVKAELEVMHVFKKTDRIYADILERFVRVEKRLRAAPPGQHRIVDQD